MSTDEAAADSTEMLLALYDRALPDVYGYLLHRCGNVMLAEDLTSQVFLAAAGFVKRGTVAELTVSWLIGVARNKLVDYWRQRAREERGLRLLQADRSRSEEAMGQEMDESGAIWTLHLLPAQYRAALVLRYVDGLPVPEVAAELGRTVHATESLLVRARREFRRRYTEGGDG